MAPVPDLNLRAAWPSSNGDGLPISRRLVLSYIVDWVFILITAAMGRVFQAIEPSRHAFRLGDPSIAFPHAKPASVTVAELMVASLVVPAVVIALLSLVAIPGRTAQRHAPLGLVWRRKLWEWNAGWMGLGVAYAATYAATEGLKASFGKPRPDLLSRCDPDFGAVAEHSVGPLAGYENMQFVGPAETLVSWTICRTQDGLRDGFVSFPSGHSSMSFAGLTYLALWLCAKLSIVFPSPWSSGNSVNPPDPRLSAFLPGTESPQAANDHPTTPDQTTGSHFAQRGGSSLPRPVPVRSQNAAPPTYLMLLAFIPVAGAAYIAASRWHDYRHFGWDILAGSLLGIIFAFVGFYMYQLPLGGGGGATAAGWAWGPRSRERAFFAGVGLVGYVGAEGTSTGKEALGHPESEAVDAAGVGAGSNGDGNAVAAARRDTSHSDFGSLSSRAATGTDRGSAFEQRDQHPPVPRE